MSDIFNLSTYSDTASSNVSTGDQRFGPDRDTGDLRRKFNFGDRVSELMIMQDPFFRLASMCAKKPTDDPSFKYTEKRPSWHKRYAYVTNHGTTAQSTLDGSDASVTASNLTAGNTYYFTMATDYMSAGNNTNVFGNSNGDITVGVAGTQPQFYIEGQVIKIPVSSSVTAASWDESSADEATKPNDYVLAKITNVDTETTSTCAILKTEIVKTMSADSELSSFQAYNDTLVGIDISGKSVAEWLEPRRSYVIGTAFAEGSGYPETWKDQPYSTGYGQTQIWKTAMAMTNTESYSVKI